MHEMSPQLETTSVIFTHANHDSISGITKLAASYPYPHSILGTLDVDCYVHKLAAQIREPAEGWYVAIRLGETIAAAHLSIYGTGNGNGHTLWKIRHPLLAQSFYAECLKTLFKRMIENAAQSRYGSAKFVIFLSEYEEDVILQARKLGFEREACFKDYYRLQETCFVFGKTLT